jgi:hypothetical protein
MIFSVGDDSYLYAVPAGNLQSPSQLSRAEKSHDRFNIRERRKRTTMGCNVTHAKFRQTPGKCLNFLTGSALQVASKEF